MRVFLGTDHAGLELKAHLLQVLADAGHEPVDCGAYSYDAQDDYPPFCFDVGERVVAEPGPLGVVIGGSGNGEQIAANKVPGIRAALAWSEETARLSREHNDAQGVAIAAPIHTQDQSSTLVDTFLATAFSNDERHARRLRMVAEFEVSTGRHPHS